MNRRCFLSLPVVGAAAAVAPLATAKERPILQGVTISGPIHLGAHEEIIIRDCRFNPSDVRHYGAVPSS